MGLFAEKYGGGVASQAGKAGGVFGKGTFTSTAAEPEPVGVFAPDEKKWYQKVMFDPIMWTLEKFNRPQQALFGAIHGGLSTALDPRYDTPEAIAADPTGWKSTMRGFTAMGKGALEGIKGKHTRFADIMDDVGLHGQAGKFDPLDIIGIVGEIAIDPLWGIGIGGKVKKVIKGAEEIASNAEAVAKLKVLGVTNEQILKARKLGLLLPAEGTGAIEREAKRLLGPDAYSHYLKLGFGAEKWAVPYSNVALEPLIAAGRWTRKGLKGFLSTQPKTLEEAIPLATKNIASRMKRGSMAMAAMFERSLPKEWQGGKFAKMVEEGTGVGLEDAPEAVQSMYETLTFFGKHLPDYAELHGVMQPKLGAAATMGKKVVGTAEELMDNMYGEGHEVIGTGTTFDPIRYKGRPPTPPPAGAYKMSPELERLHNHPARVKGFDVARAEEIESYLKQLKTLTKKRLKGKDLEAAIDDIDDAFDAFDKGAYGFATAETEKVLGRIHQFDYDVHGKPTITEVVYGIPKKLAKAEAAPSPKAAVPGAVEDVAPLYNMHDMLVEDLGVPPDDLPNYLLHSWTDDTRKYMYANDERFKSAYKGIRPAFSTSHASQISREIPGRLDEINAKFGAEGVGAFIFHPKGELLKLYRQQPKMRNLINRAVHDWEKYTKGTGEMTEAIEKVGRKAVGAGEDIAKAFDDSYHYQQFDKYMKDNFAELFGLRLGRHAVSTTVADMFRVVMKSDEGWTVPLTDAPEGFGALQLSERVRKSLTPEFLAEIDNTAWRSDIADHMAKGLKLIYDPEELSTFIKGARQVMQYVRASTILPFAGYHIANKVGNTWGIYLMGALNPKYYMMREKLLMAVNKGDLKALDEMVFNLGGRQMTGTEIANQLFYKDVMTGGWLTAEATEYGAKASLGLDTQLSLGQLFNPFKWKQLVNEVRFRDLINPVGKRQFGALVARRMEDEDRVVGFLGRLDKGDTFEDAAAQVDKHLFRYSELATAEMGAGNIPGVRDLHMFYTWYRKNMGLTMQKMWEYPGRLSMPIKIRNAFNGIYGDPDSEYEVPSYLKDRFYLYLGTDAEGKPRFLDPEKYLPPLSAARFLQGGAAGMGKQIGSSLIPPIKYMLEAGFDKEIFSGQPMQGTPGELKYMFGQPMQPKLAYLLKNIRLVGAINDIIWPSVERPTGPLKRGEPGARTAGEIGMGLARQWGGFKFQTAEAQRTRYFEAISKGGRIQSTLDKISGKLVGNITPVQRQSYLKARAELLWEKAEIIRQMIDNGTDAFTGKPLPWSTPKYQPGTEEMDSMSQLYTALYSTLRDLYFGEPAKKGELVVEPRPVIKSEEIKYVYNTMTKLKMDTLQKDFNMAIQSKDKDMLTYRVLNPIRDMVRSEKYYEEHEQGWDSHVYKYPEAFKAQLIQSFEQYVAQAWEAGLINHNSYKAILKNFREDYQ